MDEVTWINHAGFQLRSGSVSLICDPWLSGPAFDRSWNLLSATKFTAEQVGQATHIWLSHEHPDHFSPHDLRLVPAERRPKITILFQRTRDRRVAKFCESLNFRVHEIEPLAPLDLGGVSVTIDVADIDSCLHIRTPEATYLNMNDFVVSTPRQWRRLNSLVKDGLDVLLTQFSYASWQGNREDKAKREQGAVAKRRAMRQQIEEFRPNFVIPFASFIYFSHEENFYLNDSGNSIRSIYDEFNTTATRCVVLYPGDTWRLGSHDSDQSISLYEEDANRKAPQHQARNVSWNELESAALALAKRIRATNGRLLLHLLATPVVVHLTDLGCSASFCAGHPIQLTTEPSDISCSADAFLFCLKQDFGCDTLLVSGRFHEDRAGGQSRLSRAFGISRYNAKGYRGAQMVTELIRSRMT